MAQVRYRIYPTLLNAYLQYEQQTRYHDGTLFMPYEDLIDRINRVQKPTTVAQQRGVDFESALLTGKDDSAFPPQILAEMRQQLPPRFRTQVYVHATVQTNIEVYGMVDVLGNTRAIDIKTTARYEAPKFALNPQNLYLLGLHQWGIEQLDYLITDFKGVYVESYSYDTYDFDPLLAGLERFSEFLETNRPLITDTKIFRQSTPKRASKRQKNNPSDGLQTSLF